MRAGYLSFRQWGAAQFHHAHLRSRAGNGHHVLDYLAKEISGAIPNISGIGASQWNLLGLL